MKKRGSSANRHRTSHLAFTTEEPVAIAVREYGLMRTTTKTQTPYPHADPGVDANLLKARLSMRRQYEKKQSLLSTMSRERCESDHKFSYKSATTASLKNVHMGNQSSSNLNLKNSLSTGTPHPTKGVALNAKVLSTRLTNLNLELAETNSPVPETPTGTRKKKVRTMSASNVVMIQPDTTLDTERLSDISLRLTRLDYSVANSQASVSSLSSFAERRRVFDEGEFTIARKGKKMSDMMMAYTTLDKNVAGDTSHFAKQAKEEIEKYIRVQGLIKTSNDQLKWNRHLEVASPECSSDSLDEEPSPLRKK